LKDNETTKPEDLSGSMDMLRIATGAGINFVGTILKAIVGFAFTLLLSRVLSVSDLGLYTMGVTISSIAVIVCILGLDVGLWRYVSRYNAKRDQARLRGAFVGSLIVAVPISLCVSVAMAIFAVQISNAFFESNEFVTPLRAFAVTVPLLVVARLFIASTQGLQVMRYAAIRDIVEQVLRFLFTVALFVLGFRMGGALVANIAAVLVITIMSFYFLEKLYPMFSGKQNTIRQIRKLVKFSTPMGASQVLTYLIIWIDTIFLGIFYTSNEVGLYSVAMRVIVLASIVQTSFSTMFAPVISDLYVRDQHFQLQQLFKKVTRWTVLLSLPFLMPIIIFSSSVLKVFGDQFTVAATSLAILSLGQFANNLTGPVSVMIAMTGRSKLEFANSLAIALISLVLCLIFIPRWGMAGAALVNATAVTSGNIIRTIEVYILIHVQPYSLRYLKLLFAAAVAGGISYLGFTILPLGSGLLSLAVWSTVLIAIYCGTMFAMGLDEDDSEVFGLLRERFSRA